MIRLITKNKKLYSVIFFIIFFGFSFLILNINRAAAASMVRGAALWDNFGYLYFSCHDDVMGDRLDDDYNLCGGIYASPLLCGQEEPYFFHFYSAPCSGSNHQVYIANNGNFSGTAWNHYKGFVTFDATTTAPLADYSFNVNCPSPNTCDAAHNCLACYNENTQKVYGFARVISEANTWLNLNPATTSPTVQIKSWNSASSTDPTFYSSSELKAGDFIGYATTTTAANNISFNCLSAGGGSSCATYKVYLSNLQIGHLSAPNWSAVQSCGGSTLQAYLTWDLKSGCNNATSLCSPAETDNQSGFQVIVHTGNSTTTPAYNSGTVYSSANRWWINTNNFPTFDYNQYYYWWVRLLDDKGAWTQWYQFGATDDGHNGLADTITTDGVTHTSPDAKTFKTYKHEFPTPDFSWNQTDILVGATTTFTSLSKYYTSASPLAINCVGPPCSAIWSTLDPGDIITATTSPTSTDISFLNKATAAPVTLTITDADGYTCSLVRSLVINYGLPIWREVKAE